MFEQSISGILAGYQKQLSYQFQPPGNKLNLNYNFFNQ